MLWQTVVALLLGPSLAVAEVKLDAVAQRISSAMAALDLRHATAGETLTLDTIAPLDPAKPVDTAPLRAALAKQKLKVVADDPHGNEVVLTVEGANGARAMIAVGQGGGSITMTARPVTAKLPGRCVVPPTVRHPVTVSATGVDRRGERSRSEIVWNLETTPLMDVDGDAIADVFVPVAKSPDACPEAVEYRVFAMRGACGHDVGVVGPGSFAADAGTTARDRSGFRPLVLRAATTRMGKQRLPEMTTTTRTFAVKHATYVEVDRKASTGVCHHCATWTCRRR
ncbi:MAG TPA: hypothetical protein VK427_11115 [Kofleriaceae bacterium]|nr:hypothetical protein [Kofleriaceae bacterium]